MGKVELTLDVPKEGANRLFEIFGVDPIADPDKALQLEQGIAQAALAEYLLQLTGTRNPTTVRDLRELRLRLLAGHLPEHLPSDEQIAEIFQLTRTQARTLVNGARARYRQELNEMFDEATRSALRNAERIDENTVRIEASDSLATYLSEIVRLAAPPTKRADASRKYDLVRSTVEDLCEAVALPVDEVEALSKKK